MGKKKNKNKKENIAKEKENEENNNITNKTNSLEKNTNLNRNNKNKSELIIKNNTTKVNNQKENKNEEKKKNEKEKIEKIKIEKEQDDNSIYVKRIINVEMTKEMQKFLNIFQQQRKKIINWCEQNKHLYVDKVNKKTYDIFINQTENLNKIFKEKSINIDNLSIIVYFYNLYSINNNNEKINFNDLTANSYISFRGIYENIDKKSKTFKELLKEEKKYKKIYEKQNNNICDLFSNYKKTFPYSINLFLGIFFTFFSGYYGSLLIGYNKTTTRLICGIIFSYFGLILEVFIFIIIYEKSEKLKKRKIKLNTYDGLYKKTSITDEIKNEKMEILKKDKLNNVKKRKN